MATIKIPTPLRRFVAEKSSVDIDAPTVGDALQRLVEEHSALKQHLYDEQGKLRNFVNVYLNNTDVRQLAREETPVRPGDTLVIVPSIAGGGRNK